MRYKAYTLRNFRDIEQLKNVDKEIIEAVEVVGSVMPFRVNSYVIDELIDWENIPNDPIFQLTFPQRGMLPPDQYERVREMLGTNELQELVTTIRRGLNPHPAGQMQYNVPLLHGEPMAGIQHKYRETVLFFPRQGQTCFSFCTFCFRWPQFVGVDELRFASREIDQLVAYLQEHPEVQDVLFTGGDPMVMSPGVLSRYIRPLIEERPEGLRSIRIGTKVLSYNPYKFLDDEGEGYISLFEEVSEAGLHLAIMAHFNHPNEMRTKTLVDAVNAIRKTGAQIRTQSPVLNHINNDPSAWTEMWRRQVDLGMIPYYMFVVRDTGAKEYFKVPLVRAWEVFRQAYRNVSGLCRTVRGPSMSTTWGKIEVMGKTTIGGQALLALRFIQGRDARWVGRPFFAKYDANASWVDELKPVEGGRFFFQKDEDYLRSYDRIRQMEESSAQT